MENYLLSIAEELNSKPCPFCGKIHKVELNFSKTAPHLQSMLFYKVSEDSCERYKELVKKRLTTL